MPRVLFLCAALTLAGAVSDLAVAQRPNFILVLVDDLGWKDVGCYGNDFVETPRIDRLAAEGLRFTDAYAAGAVCSPTRCAVQSGQNQARIGITAHIPGHWRPFERVITPRTTMALPLDTVTVGEALKESGYVTGYVGKWHLGRAAMFQPSHQGYDFTAVVDGPHLPGRFRVSGRSDLEPGPGQYRTEFEADLGVDFIRQNKRRPFFLMVSPLAVHIPLAAMSHKVEKYRNKAAATGRALPHPVYAAMIEHCDDMLGRIVDTVAAEGLTERTMIVFTSDNGGLHRRYDYQARADDEVTSMTPLKGEKGSLHEGGVRVPLIVKYPALTRPGAVCAEPAISYDFYPTFVDLAGGSLPANQSIDGVSLRPLLVQPDGRLEREALYWHYPHYHHDRPASSIRARDWKLIEYLDGTGDTELYHLAVDVGETRNLVSEEKARAADLKTRLAQWRTAVIARMPTPNPNFDQERAGEWWSMRTGRPIPSDSRRRFPPTEKEWNEEGRAGAAQVEPATPFDAGKPLCFDVKLLAVDTNEGCDVGDVNRDGVPDVVAGRFWFAGPDFTPRPLRVIAEFGKDYSATNGEFLYDVDGDGWLDVLSIPFMESELCWYRNPGRQGLKYGRLWPRHLLVDTKQGANEAAWLRDMDGDGRPEFIVNSWNVGTPMSYWKLGKTSEGVPTATRVFVAIGGNGHGQGFGDVNQDGREDIVFGGGWYERPAEPGLWQLHEDFALPQASCPVLVVDLNRDGRSDMLWGSGHDYGLYYHEQLEPADGKTRWQHHLIDKSWSQAHALAWADLTGDGSPDLITGKRVRAHSGSDPGSDEPPVLYCYSWNETRQRFRRQLIATGVGTGLQIRAVDMNGDGRMDLVTAGKDGTQVLLQR